MTGIVRLGFVAKIAAFAACKKPVTVGLAGIG